MRLKVNDNLSQCSACRTAFRFRQIPYLFAHDVRLLKQMKGVSDSLRSVQVNAAVTCNLVANCVDFFPLRNVLVISASRMEEANRLCTELDSSLEFCPRRRPTQIPRHLEGDVFVSEKIGDSGRSKTDIDTFTLTDVYYPAILKLGLLNYR